MELEFKLTEADYINYNIDHSKNSATLKRSIWLQRLLGPVIFILAAFTIIRFSEIPSWYWIIVFSLSSIAWFLYYPKYIHRDIKRKVKKMLEEGSNENLFNKRRLLLTKEGIVEISSINESKITWDKIVRLEENKDYLYIYISSVSAHIVPKRVFKNVQDEKAFINKISEELR